MRLRKLASIVLVLCCVACRPDVEVRSDQEVYFDGQWDQHVIPTSATPQVYGFYTHGCLDGGQKMATEGQGYHLVRARRGRVYGHPQLITFLEELAANHYTRYKENLLISDLGQARGGPPKKSSKHLSHQTGLDVDIWYRRILPFENVEKAEPRSVLDYQKEHLGKGWNARNAELLQTIAAYPEVERVLVTPRVKERLCDLYQGKAWLSKIRPWWGHDRHFHVRLACPEGSPHCQSQAAVPPYLGCGDELQWWFSEEAKEAAKKETKRPEKIYLPNQCFEVYHSRNSG